MARAPTKTLAIALGIAVVTGTAVVVWLTQRGSRAAETPPPPPRDAAADARVAIAKDAAVDRFAPPQETVDDSLAPTLEEQRERLLRRIELWYRPGEKAMAEVRALFAASSILGQGNPAVTEHPMKRSECLAIKGRKPGDPRCGAPNMVPLYDPAKSEPKNARVCIDQYEFPNIACEYPVTNVRSSEASAICKALGKRICDAHEWEGACAGALLDAESEYHWGERRIQQSYLHNQKREKVWAYGATKNHARCATASKKSDKCTASGWKQCGSNTYPAGAFVECVSRLGVYDLHGNAAEHMNLPLEPQELASRGGSGRTEMKGSWFIFLRGEAHEDDCRWRAPSWHDSALNDAESHRNYHLGFRCCRDL